MDEVMGFSVSQEELLVALILAELPAPVGFDDLDVRVFGDLEEKARFSLLAAAERSMLARGYLRGDEPVLDETVRVTLSACTQPRWTWIVIHQPSGEPQRTTYVHQGENVLVAHMSQGAIHQFLHLADPSDIHAAVMELIAPVTNEEVAPLSGQLAERAFAAIADAGGRRDRVALSSQLRAAGWDAQTTETFATTVDQLTSITAFARLNYGVEPPLERAFSIVHGAGKHWIVRLTAPGTVEVQQLGGPALDRGLRDFAQEPQV